MKHLISQCPVCQRGLKISALQCPGCGLELRNDFELSRFDQLSHEQYEFLMTFLKYRGNLKNLQAELQISYPFAKKKLDELLTALGFEAEEPEKTEEIDMRNIEIDHSSSKASEIIKAKLMGNGGCAMIRTFDGKLREIKALPNGNEFRYPKVPPFDYKVFDAIVDLLMHSPGYRAKKGNARKAKLGEYGCEANTVAGTVLMYMGKKPGESGLDPTFILSAVLDWAGIVSNGRGYISLTESYRSRL